MRTQEWAISSELRRKKFWKNLPMLPSAEPMLGCFVSCFKPAQTTIDYSTLGVEQQQSQNIMNLLHFCELLIELQTASKSNSCCTHCMKIKKLSLLDWSKNSGYTQSPWPMQEQASRRRFCYTTLEKHECIRCQPQSPCTLLFCSVSWGSLLPCCCFEKNSGLSGILLIVLRKDVYCHCSSSSWENFLFTVFLELKKKKYLV